MVISSVSTVVEADRRIGVSERPSTAGGPSTGASESTRPGTRSSWRPGTAGSSGRWPNSPWTTRYSRTPLRETCEPRPRPVCPTRPVSLGGIGAEGLQRAGTAPHDSSPRAVGPGRQAGSDQRNGGAGHPVRPVRLPADHRPAQRCRLECEPQTGRADLAARGVEGAGEPAPERPAVAERRVVGQAETGGEKPCVGL